MPNYSVKCDPTELRPVCPSSYPINDCGRPEPPPGEFIDLQCVLVEALVLNPNESIPDVRTRVPEDFPFVLVSMSVHLDPAFPTSDFLYKLQYPDGRYASNIRQSVLITAGIGNRRRNFYPGELYPAGDFIPMELENTTADRLTVCIFYEGFKRMYLK